MIHPTIEIAQFLTRDKSYNQEICYKTEPYTVYYLTKGRYRIFDFYSGNGNLIEKQDVLSTYLRLVKTYSRPLQLQTGLKCSDKKIQISTACRLLKLNHFIKHVKRDKQYMKLDF